MRLVFLRARCKWNAFLVNLCGLWYTISKENIKMIFLCSGKEVAKVSGRMKIRIAGHEYVMRADETEEYMNTVAELAQSVVAECGGTSDYASTRALILATVNLADRCIKAEQKLKEVLRILEEATIENAQTEDEVVSELLSDAETAAPKAATDTDIKDFIETETQADVATPACDVKLQEDLAEESDAAVVNESLQDAQATEDEVLLNELRAAREKVALLEKEKKTLQSELTRSRSRKNKRR